MKRLTVIAIILIVAFATQSFGFDGTRHGFVIGGGLGFSPVSRWSLADSRYTLGGQGSESRPGLGMDFLVGYAFDDYNILAYEGNATAYSSHLNDRTALQEADAFCWYH